MGSEVGKEVGIVTLVSSFINTSLAIVKRADFGTTFGVQPENADEGDPVPALY